MYTCLFLSFSNDNIFGAGLVFSGDVRSRRPTDRERFSLSPKVQGYRTIIESARVLDRVRLPEGLENESYPQVRGLVKKTTRQQLLTVPG